MFAYCGNNPSNLYDPSGTFSLVCYHDDLFGESFEQFGGGGGGRSVAGTNAATGNAATAAVTAVAICGAKAIADATTSQGKEEQSYSVYFLYAMNGDPSTIVYVGRVKTNNMASRMAYHRSKGRELAYSIDGLTYMQCRAIEQGGMMYHHTINRTNQLHNQIRGVSPTNNNRLSYFLAIIEMISTGSYIDNPYLPASYWENLTEEQWLNGL